MRKVFLVLPLFAAAAFAADDAPAWVRQAAAATTPKYDGKVKAVVIHDDSRVDVEEGGKVTTTFQHAVRILTKEGRSAASAVVFYETSGGKVRQMNAWIIRASGEVKKFGKDRIVDMAADDHDVYDEARVQVVEAEKDVDVGDLFAFEWVREDRMVFLQFEERFQKGVHPALLSRYTVNVPAGWRVQGITFNHAKIDPAISETTGASSYAWQLQDMAPIEMEPSSPRLSSIVPRIAVSVIAPPGARTGLGKSFENWQDVSRWLAELADPQAVTSPEMTAKTQQLTAGAKSEIERIQAIGRYVQSVKYVSIQTGIGRGGGYKPHLASQVFAKSYGDCKDKATLMRTMLKLAGIESYPLSIFSGDPMFVRQEWASPQQFNHAIIAIRVSDDVKLNAVGTYPDLGRLLIFDPTDEHTQVGMIPEYEEGSLALINSPDHGALIRMPRSAPEANHLKRHFDVTLEPDGSIAAKLEETAMGHPGASYRSEIDHLQKADFRKRIESWVGNSGPGATLKSLDSSAGDNDSVQLRVEFNTPRYAKSIQGSLLVVKTGVLPPRERVHLAEPTRKYPVVVNAESYEETMTMTLPAGFAVDEMPRPRNATTEFGSMSTSCDAKDGVLTCKRSFTVTAQVIPVDKYKEARTFFSAIYGSGDEPVVLAKK